MKDKPNPADRTFFSNLFTSIAEEMGGTLVRTAYSPNIKERRDFSCALFDAEGELLAQAAHIPVHLGALPMSMRAVLDRWGPLQPGDMVILNDPYAGGTHLPDITLASPVYVGKRLLAYVVTRAHHADVGGMTPGSLPLSRDIHQEGLRLPPVKLYEEGRLNESIPELIKANVRTPDERMGDLRAQQAAHGTGATRLTEAVEKYGERVLRGHMKDLMTYGRELMRALLRRIPDGEFVFDDVLDDDGVASEPIRIRVKIGKKAGRVTVDFTGSDPACAGSLNSVEPVTRSAVYYCFLALLVTPWGEKGRTHDPPLNGGCLEPIRVVAPPGSIVNADPPHAVAGGNVETSQRIVDVVLGALSKALPKVIPAASQGTMNNLTLGGWDPVRKRPFAYYETMGGGMGARPGKGGIDAVQAHMTNTLNTPVEALEFAYPLRVERYEMLERTGGQGRHTGGDGLVREVRMLCDAQGALLSERRRHAPYGLRGGRPGKTGRNDLIRDGRRRALPGKVSLDLKADDVLAIRTPGGGGWGRPMKKAGRKK